MDTLSEYDRKIRIDADIDKQVRESLAVRNVYADAQLDELDAWAATFHDSGYQEQVLKDVVQPATEIPSEPTSSLETPYSFATRMDDVAHVGVGPVVKRMSELVAEWQRHGDYMQVRADYCSLAISLNRECLLAPDFRPTPKIPKIKSRRSPADLTLHRDLLVIDCHWLRCRREDVWPRDDEYDSLFDANVPFSFDLAAAFACRNWTKLHRTDEALILTTRQQCQLKTMKGTVVRDRLILAEDGLGRGEERTRPKIVSVRKAMREWCSKDKRIIPYRKSYEDLWLARELLGTGASMKDIAVLGGLIAGVLPSSERTVRGKLNRLDKRMTGASTGV